MADPTISDSLNHSWPLDQIVSWFLSSPTWGITHFFTDTQKHNRVGGRKEQTNKHGIESAPSARKDKSVTLCILWANASVYSSENSHPASTDLISLSDFCWLSSLPCSHLLTAFCRLCPSLDCYLKPTDFFCSLLLTHLFSQTFLPSSFRSHGRSRTLALCVGFAPKQTKWSSEWHPHTHTTNANIVSHCTFFLKAKKKKGEKRFSKRISLCLNDFFAILFLNNW